MIRRGCRRLLAASLATLVLQPSASNCQPRRGNDGTALAEGPVEVSVVGSAADLEWARVLVGPKTLGGEPAHFVRADRFDPLDFLRAPVERREKRIECWLDLSNPRRARLYLVARSAERFMVRDIQLSGKRDELDKESLGQVMELSVRALLENEQAGMSRAEVETVLTKDNPPTPPASAPPPHAETSAATGVGQLSPTTEEQLTSTDPRIPPLPLLAGAFYAAQIQSRDLPTIHGPGLSLATSESLMRRAAVWLRGQYQLPATERGDYVGLQFEAIAVRGGASVRWPAGNSTAGHGAPAAGCDVQAEFGLGADWVRLSPQPGTKDPSALLTPARWSRSLVITAAIAAAVPIHRRLWLALRLFVDVLPTAVHYDVQIDGATSAVFTPWRIRPGLAAELSLR